MKLSRMQLEVLNAIAAHEDAGKIGANPDLYPTRTVVGLDRAGLILHPNVDGSRSLSTSGWSAIGRKPKCEASTQICSGEIVRTVGVNGSIQEGKTFQICAACIVYLKRGGTKFQEISER